MNTLRVDRPYMIESNIISGDSFDSYELPIDPSGRPEHDDRIVNVNQFFTYRGEEILLISDLSSEVKSRIARIYSEGPTVGGSFGVWTPSSLFPPFSSFVPGKIYLIQSEIEGFAPYDLGLPAEALLSFLNDSLLPDIGLVPQDYIEA